MQLLENMEENLILMSENLYEELNILEDKLDTAILNGDLEIQEILVEKIRKIKTKISKNNRKIFNYYKKFVSCSRFNKDDFGRIVSLLMSLVEGKETDYVLKEIYRDDLHDEEMKPGCLQYKFMKYMRPYGEKDRKCAIKVGLKDVVYNDRIFDHNGMNGISEELLNIRDGKLFVLNYKNSDKNSSEFNVYDLDFRTFEKWEENYCSVPTMLCSFGKYKYIYDFINYVIDYRVKNDMKEISYSELLKLLRSFLPSISEIAEKNYETLEKDTYPFLYADLNNAIKNYASHMNIQNAYRYMLDEDYKDIEEKLGELGLSMKPKN